MTGHAAEQAMLDARVDDPTRGLFSATALKSGIVAERALYAGISDIVQARGPVADLNQLVNDWRNSAGDAMRAEYQEALQRHD